MYLRNRSPTKPVSGTTPYEAWTGVKPQVDGLRVFGCQAFAHIPKDERKKLDLKSKKCIFLGYGINTKGYRQYDPLRKKLFHSKDIIFNKQKFGFDESTEPQKEPEGHVYLECSPPADPPTPSTDEPLTINLNLLVDRSGLRKENNQTTESRSLSWLMMLYQGRSRVMLMKAEIDSLKTHDVWELVEHS